MKIEPHSLTWQAVKKFIESEKQVAIDCLIEDFKSEQQRGALIVLERLEALESPEDFNQP